MGAGRGVGGGLPSLFAPPMASTIASTFAISATAGVIESDEPDGSSDHSRATQLQATRSHGIKFRGLREPAGGGGGVGAVVDAVWYGHAHGLPSVLCW